MANKLRHDRTSAHDVLDCPSSGEHRGINPFPVTDGRCEESCCEVLLPPTADLVRQIERLRWIVAELLMENERLRQLLD